MSNATNKFSPEVRARAERMVSGTASIHAAQDDDARRRGSPRGRHHVLATQYDRYGYRRIAALLEQSGWAVNIKRVERIWRQEGLKVQSKQPKKIIPPERTAGIIGS